MHLVMFDIDGTLTATQGIDDKLYALAVTDALGIMSMNTNWGEYQYVSDAGILSEIIQTHLQRQATLEDQQCVCRHFVRLLRQGKRDIRKVKGADTMLNRLQAEPNLHIAIASGSWQDSADLKLKIAGLDVSEIPMATSDDAIARDEIMAIAYQRACQHYGQEHYDKITYVGDGVWDVINARKMKYAFIGIGTGDKADTLRQAGAEHVFGDFQDVDKILDVLRT